MCVCGQGADLRPQMYSNLVMISWYFPLILYSFVFTLLSVLSQKLHQSLGDVIPKA